MARNIVLISFANARFKPTLIRLQNEVNELKFITSSYYFTEKDLDKEFRRNFNPSIYRRGYGYWKWKPYLSKKVMDKLETDDILIWCDAGVALNTKADNNFNYYIELVSQSKSGILAFQDIHIERLYNKADCLAYFGVLSNPKITDTPQYWAGCWMLKKTEKSVELLNRWYNAIMDDFDLITDKKSRLPNFPKFIDHRHDQSVFSILLKQYDIECVSYSEAIAKNSIIYEKRDKRKTKIGNITFKFLFPLRFIIWFYLVYFKRFYSKNRIIW